MNFSDAVELVADRPGFHFAAAATFIGYTRGLFNDDLKRYVEYEGSKPREVIVTPEQAARLYEEFKKTNP